MNIDAELTSRVDSVKRHYAAYLHERAIFSPQDEVLWTTRPRGKAREIRCVVEEILLPLHVPDKIKYPGLHKNPQVKQARRYISYVISEIDGGDIHHRFHRAKTKDLRRSENVVKINNIKYPKPPLLLTAAAGVFVLLKRTAEYVKTAIAKTPMPSYAAKKVNGNIPEYLQEHIAELPKVVTALDKSIEAIERVRRFEQEGVFPVDSAKNIETGVTPVSHDNLEEWMGMDDRSFIKVGLLICQLGYRFVRARDLLSKELDKYSSIEELVMAAIAQRKECTVKNVGNGELFYEVIARRCNPPDEIQKTLTYESDTRGALGRCVIDILQKRGRSMKARAIYNALLAKGFVIHPPKDRTAFEYLSIRLNRMKGVKRTGRALFSTVP